MNCFQWMDAIKFLLLIRKKVPIIINYLKILISLKKYIFIHKYIIFSLLIIL